MIEKRNFIGREYNILSRKYVDKDSKESNFGDLLTEFSLEYGLKDISSFIKTHIARRSKNPGEKDPERDLFLQYMVALRVLTPVKLGNEKGYEISRKPDSSDFIDARNFSIDKHENDRGFEAFKSNETYLKATASKSSRFMSKLISVLLINSNYVRNVKYTLNEVKMTLGLLYTDKTVGNIIDCLTTRHITELTYVYKDDELVESLIEFNYLPLKPDDLQCYTSIKCIPAGCESVKTVIKGNDIPYNESYESLMDYLSRNITYLIKNGKMPEIKF